MPLQKQTTSEESGGLPLKAAEMSPCIVKPGDPWPLWIPDYRLDFERPHCTLVGWSLRFMEAPAGLFESWEIFWFAHRQKRQFYCRWTGVRPERVKNKTAARLPPDYEPGDKIGREKVIERLNNSENAVSVIIRPDLLPDKPALVKFQMPEELKKKCKTIYEDNYAELTFNEFLSVMVSWGIDEAKLRIGARNA